MVSIYGTAAGITHVVLSLSLGFTHGAINVRAVLTHVVSNNTLDLTNNFNNEIYGVIKGCLISFMMS